MDSIDSDVVLLTCADHTVGVRAGWLPVHGSRPLTAASRVAAAGVPRIDLPAVPERAHVDPLLARPGLRRLVVAGPDAALAAVLVRLLRRERLDVELAFLPTARSPAAIAWGLPTGAGAAAHALDAAASAVPLVRDDAGGVLVGRGEIRGLRGEVYCDSTLVMRGGTPWLVTAPSPAGVAVRAGRGRALPDGTVRPVPPTAARGRGAAVGRAVQVGCLPARVVLDGIAHPRPVPRWTWYRHTADWLLVRP